LCDTIVLDDYFISSRDLVGKGKIVYPSGKQRKEVCMVADSFRFQGQSSSAQRRKSSGETDGTIDSGDYISNSYFDLNDKPRTFICSGAIYRVEPGCFSCLILFITSMF
jgi:hypothetical protein